MELIQYRESSANAIDERVTSSSISDILKDTVALTSSAEHNPEYSSYQEIGEFVSIVNTLL
jgi:hypothetical protein